MRGSGHFRRGTVPIFFKRVGLDPALMSGPFISSLMDVFTLLLYLKLAGAIIPY